MHYSFFGSRGRHSRRDPSALHHSSVNGVDGAGVAKIRDGRSLSRPFGYEANRAMLRALVGDTAKGLERVRPLPGDSGCSTVIIADPINSNKRARRRMFFISPKEMTG